MADFDPPFGQDSDWRLPTTQEKQLGFPCGGADQRLFNGIFRLLFGQIADIAQEAGVSSNSEGDQTVLRRAVLALIDTYLGQIGEGEEDFSNFILLSQAQNRLPIFPEIENSTGRITPAVPDTGSVQIPSGISFLHRGIRRYSTSDWDSESRTFATEASKIYHLRWHRDTGFALRDLADTGSYNPGSLAETDTGFDTTYDDMLIARIITNSSNVATITGLANRNRLRNVHAGSHNFGSLSAGRHASAIATDVIPLNWARTGRHIPIPLGTHAPEGAIAGGMDIQLGAGASGSMPGASFLPLQLNRYGFRVGLQAANTTTGTRTVTAAYEVHSEA